MYTVKAIQQRHWYMDTDPEAAQLMAQYLQSQLG